MTRMRLWKRLAGSAMSLIAMTIVAAAGEAPVQQRDQPPRGVLHGRDVSAKLVGPAAAGVPAGASYGGQTIRDETVAPFLRKIATTARYDGFTISGGTSSPSPHACDCNKLFCNSSS